MLKAVDADIAADLHRGDNHSSHKYLSNYVASYAGSPLLYGICMQRQIVDGARYPRCFKVSNGNMPYLYSLVGSWGPTMFPLFWKAFLKFVKHVNRPGAVPVSPLTRQRGMVNHFFWDTERRRLDKVSNRISVHNNANVNEAADEALRTLPLKSIWTPWMTLFSAETHSSCLYVNLPRNLSLVINHREKGQNYASGAGPDAELLLAQHFDGNTDHADELLVGEYLRRHALASLSAGIPTELLAKASILSAKWATTRQLRSLRSAYTYFPPLKRLSEWQYDVLSYRVGAFGASADHYCLLSQLSAPDDGGIFEHLQSKCLLLYGESSLHYTNITENSGEDRPLCRVLLSLRKSVELAQDSVELFLSSYPANIQDRTRNQILEENNRISLDHWLAILDMIESNMSPHSTILHIGHVHSPLLFMLLSRYWYHDVRILSGIFETRGLKCASEGDDSSDANVQMQCEFLTKLAVDADKPRIACGGINTCAGTSANTGKHDLAIVSQTHLALVTDVFNGSSLRKPLYLNLPSFEYLLVLGPCFGAPSSVFIEQADTNTDTHECTLVRRYSLVEDVCREGLSVDTGAVLYRGQDWEYQHQDTGSHVDNGNGNSYTPNMSGAWAVMRRLRGRLATRQVKTPPGTMWS